MNTFYRERIEQLPAPFVSTLDAIMDVITAIEEVGRVILFGSCSRGTQTESSDIDLLILLNSMEAGMPFRKLEEQVGVAIYDRFTFNGKTPVDLLFADEATYMNSSDPKSVYQRVKRDGVVLYE